MSMTIEAARPMVAVGEMVGTFAIPAIGLILLIIGFTQRSRSTTTPQHPYPPQLPPGYPPPGYPQGYPQQGYPQPGYPPQNYPPQGYAPPGYPPQQFGHPAAQPGPYPYQPPATKRGTALIIIGAVLLAFGLLGLVGRAAGHSTRTHTSAGMNPTSITMADPIGPSI